MALEWVRIKIFHHMKKRLLYHDPLTGKKIYLSEKTLITLTIIIGCCFVATAYWASWVIGVVTVCLLRNHKRIGGLLLDEAEEPPK